jgi:type IV pilus assembly protein PilA
MQNMLANLRTRREDDERGFTLIELMVVVLIIAILIAIAIPTFLGAKSRAQDKAAQSSLRNALTNAKGIYTDSDSYGTTASLVTGLATAEPSLTFQDDTTASLNAKQVSVKVVDATHVIFVAYSSSQSCYAIGDAANGPGTVFAKVTGTCSGGNAATALGTPSTPVSSATNTSTADRWSTAF